MRLWRPEFAESPGDQLVWLSHALPWVLVDCCTMRTIRVGLVGSRFAARFHWEGLRRVYGIPVDIVGVTSRSAATRDAFAQEKRDSFLRYI